jgi:tetratricopeptide (TPR) repeat protein
VSARGRLLFTRHTGAGRLSHFAPMKSFRLFFLLLMWLPFTLAHAAEQPAPAEATAALKKLVERQRELLAKAAEKTDQASIEDMRAEFQDLVFSFDDYLKKYPDVAAGYVSYALLLNQPVIGERKRAAMLLLKANRLDPNLPLVKNQLGNYLAEEGKPLEALNYYLAAVKLAPQEPLYHYQIGTLLTEAREDFVKSDAWTRETLDEAMQNAFEQAHALAPDNVGYAYRYGESFYDLERPEWSAALAYWQSFESKMTSAIGKETARLHQANVLIQQKKTAEARAVLATVNEETLKTQKEKLVAQLAAEPAK